MTATPSTTLWLEAQDLASLWDLPLTAWLRMARRLAWPVQKIAGVWCLPRPWAAKRLAIDLDVLAGLRDGRWATSSDPLVQAWLGRARADLAPGHPLLAKIHKVQGIGRIAFAMDVREAVEALAYQKAAKKKAPA